MKKWLIISLVILVLAIAAVIIKFTLFSGVKGVDYSCVSDSECILVQDNCCSCFQDPKSTKAINSNSKTAWDEGMGCGLAICETCPTELPQLTTQCVNNKCEVV